MSRLTKLKAAKSLQNVAALLYFTPTGLAYNLYKIPPANKYKSFSIPKKNGGNRKIDAPNDKLKLMQARLADLLYDCLDEIEEANPARRRISHGFHRRRGIISNALPHRRARYVLNLDILDFFGSINFGRVRGFFIADRSFGLDPAAATILAQIACHDNRLPQGSPCSPVISNLIMRILDVRLARLAKSQGCMYTRYADDITFSTRLRTFPATLAKPAASVPNRWRLMRRLSDEITTAGFKINQKKTRMQIIGSRQEVTGIIVNEKININQYYYRTIRSMCNSLFQTGSYHLPDADVGHDGSIITTNKLPPLEGRLSHLYYIKARRDRSEGVNRQLNHTPPKAIKSLYRKYLYFKYFINLNKPLIITEGKTDIIYLQAAIRATHPNYSQLTKSVNGTLQILPDFLRPSFINNTILGLGSGTSQIPEFIRTFSSRTDGFGHSPMRSPVIIVVDNDQGGIEVCSAAKAISGKPITLKNPDCWFHLTQNLYIVKTPPGPGTKKHSCIEDLFPAHLKAMLVDGKPFDIKKLHSDETAYGKTIFAEQVVRKFAKPVDFSGWQLLLDALNDAIDDYAMKIAAKIIQKSNVRKNKIES